MTKQNEIDTLLACAKTLSGDSYCGPWLLDQIPFIEHDMRSDILPTPTWSESRRMHDSTLANAREQAANILKNAKEEAEKLKADAIKYSESVRESLRRDLQRAIDAV
jgi:hypothetical protein